MRDIDDLPKNKANHTALTPLWFLERAATVHPTRSSLIHGSLRYTWLDTYRRCCRLASALSINPIGLGSTEPADNNCVYRNEVIHAVAEQTQVLQDVAADPTLPRTKEVQCPLCKHSEAVFFQATARGEEGMTLFFVERVTSWVSGGEKERIC